MRILVVGNTGFKGSWLTLLLKKLGHEVSGIGLRAPSESLFNIAKVENSTKEAFCLDICNRSRLIEKVSDIDPDFIFHLAAQPIVSKGYDKLFETFQINVAGTLNVIEAAASASRVRGLLVVTSDKVYRNHSKAEVFFKEGAPLGFGDPYSSSKAVSDFLTQAFMHQNIDMPIGIARAGNIIGGGDFGDNRLIPDLVRNIFNNEELHIRNPNGVRPWQYVLDCLYGYIQQMHRIIDGQKTIYNFGPKGQESFSVQDLINTFLLSVNGELPATVSIGTSNFHESHTLNIDSALACEEMGWEAKVEFQELIGRTADWYMAWWKGRDMEDFSMRQIEEYLLAYD